MARPIQVIRMTTGSAGRPLRRGAARPLLAEPLPVFFFPERPVVPRPDFPLAPRRFAVPDLPPEPPRLLEPLRAPEPLRVPEPALPEPPRAPALVRRPELPRLPDVLLRVLEPDRVVELGRERGRGLSLSSLMPSASKAASSKSASADPPC